MQELKKIDIHAHALACSRAGCNFLTGEQLLARYDALGIEYGVLLPLVSNQRAAIPISNQETKEVAQGGNGRFFYMCGVDPRSFTSREALYEFLRAEQAQGARGVGELVSNIPIDGVENEALFACCEALGLPVLFHMTARVDEKSYGVVDALGLPGLERMLARFPQLAFIGHAQAFWSEISADNHEGIRNTRPTGRVLEGRIAELMRRYSNLYCDLSAGSGANAMLRDPEYAIGFLNEFSSRILYGCDICSATNTHPEQLRDLLRSLLENGHISQTVYAEMVRENAIRLFRLSV